MRVVQQCINELISLGENTNWSFDTNNVLDRANDVDNVLHQLINWEAPLEVRRAIANAILNNISLLITTSNKAFQINKI